MRVKCGRIIRFCMILSANILSIESGRHQPLFVCSELPQINIFFSHSVSENTENDLNFIGSESIETHVALTMASNGETIETIISR